MRAERRSTGTDTDWLSELQALYRRVDALYEGWQCPASTECCRFGITGRQPYVTSIEASAILHALARRGGPLSAQRRALPIAKSAELERVCPLLDHNQRCSVYGARPLGCRTFYCQRAQPGAGPTRAELRALTRELQELAARHRMGGEAGRPLLRVLETGSWSG